MTYTNEYIGKVINELVETNEALTKELKTERLSRDYWHDLYMNGGPKNTVSINEYEALKSEYQSTKEELERVRETLNSADRLYDKAIKERNDWMSRFEKSEQRYEVLNTSFDDLVIRIREALEY